MPHINDFQDKIHLNMLTTKFLDECSIKLKAQKQLKHIFIKKKEAKLNKRKREKQKTTHKDFEEILFISDIYLHDNIQEVYVSPHPYAFDMMSAEHLK